LFLTNLGFMDFLFYFQLLIGVIAQLSNRSSQECPGHAHVAIHK
jgi:hypothetical protein